MLLKIICCSTLWQFPSDQNFDALLKRCCKCYLHDLATIMVKIAWEKMKYEYEYGTKSS
jgi:hypothetical protein